MSDSNDSDDDDLYYEMNDDPIILQGSYEKKSVNTDNSIEPQTPTEEFDESFYQITNDQPVPVNQAYIDEPLTPSDMNNPNFRYVMLTQEEYKQLMMSHVENAKTILQLPSSIIKILLNHFKWDETKLFEEFYDKSREDLFKNAQLVYKDENQLSTEEQPSFCLICCSDEPGEMFSLACNHMFCRECWRTYLHRQINSEGLADKISCPDDQCQTLVDDETVKDFLGNDQSILEIYQKIVMNSYVENNPRARWCPGKGCGFIVHGTSLTSSYNYAQLILCSNCKISFCFQCAQPWHDPIKCKLLLEWNRRMFDENQTKVWIKAHTKICPKCSVNIEKNGGCDHMTCRHCKHEFCWLCFGKWSTHSSCNRFNNENLILEQTELALKLARYEHYYERFRNHEHSLELDEKTFKNFQNKSKLTPLDITHGDNQIVERAFEVLLKCRQLLTYTYPFAYYLNKNNQSTVFEENQAYVEQSCQQLSQLLGANFHDEQIMNKFRIELIENTRYCEAQQSVLLKHVKEGYTQNYWQYLEPN